MHSHQVSSINMRYENIRKDSTDKQGTEDESYMAKSDDSFTANRMNNAYSPSKFTDFSPKPIKENNSNSKKSRIPKLGISPQKKDE